MIPDAYVTAWSNRAPWPTLGQIEQDLILSRLIVEIANHPYLGQELVFRGGTCLHKLHLDTARRYSEDLDYVRSTAGGIGPLTAAVTELGENLGFKVNTQISRHPKMYLRAEAGDGSRLRIKVEVNTVERSPVQPTITLPHTIETDWWSGAADVRTFTPNELVATKIRALYQRKKGRDLFDLWLALTEMKLSPADIVGAFGPYRPEGMTKALAERNLIAKINDAEFSNDLAPLVGAWPDDYNVPDAAARVIEEIHALL